MNVRLNWEGLMRCVGTKRSLPFPPGTTDSGSFRWKRVVAGLVFAAVTACVAQDGKPAGGSENQPRQAPSSVGKDEARQSKQEKAAAVESQRRKQITEDSSHLLTMALALKAEVDKTTKDTLSLNVIRKADQIEKLAHAVKEKMKQSAGAS